MLDVCGSSIYVSVAFLSKIVPLTEKFFLRQLTLSYTHIECLSLRRFLKKQVNL